MTMIIVLTGSIGTGKSTIANKMKQLNIPVIDADVIAREVVEPGKEAYNKIVETFGTDILFPDKTLDRKKLGSIVFADEQKRKLLNEIVHPAIRNEMNAQREFFINRGERCIVLDIPLFYEGGGRSYEYDKVIVVATSPEKQLERVMKRDNSTKEEAEQRIRSQKPVYEKAKKADAVIDNNGTIEEAEQQLVDILLEWGVIDEADVEVH